MSAKPFNPLVLLAIAIAVIGFRPICGMTHAHTLGNCHTHETPDEHGHDHSHLTHSHDHDHDEPGPDPHEDPDHRHGMLDHTQETPPQWWVPQRAVEIGLPDAVPALLGDETLPARTWTDARLVRPPIDRRCDTPPGSPMGTIILRL